MTKLGARAMVKDELAELGMCRLGVEGKFMSYCAYDIAHIVV